MGRRNIRANKPRISSKSDTKTDEDVPKSSSWIKRWAGDLSALTADWTGINDPEMDDFEPHPNMHIPGTPQFVVNRFRTDFELEFHYKVLAIRNNKRDSKESKTKQITKLHDQYATRRAWWRVKILGQRVLYAFWLGYVLFVCYHRWSRLSSRGKPIFFSTDPTQFQETFREKLETQPNDVLLFFSALYVLKQTFSIPGSALLNCLAGMLFGTWKGFSLVVLLNTIGASSCYWLSYYVLDDVLNICFPAQIDFMRDLVKKNKSNLFLFLVSLRIAPATPNWLLNLASPLAHVPFWAHAASVAVGLMPYNYLTVSIGEMLASVDGASHPRFDWETIAKLALAAIVIFGVAWFRQSRSAPETMESMKIDRFRRENHVNNRAPRNKAAIRRQMLANQRNNIKDN